MASESRPGFEMIEVELSPEEWAWVDRARGALSRDEFIVAACIEYLDAIEAPPASNDQPARRSNAG
jgi:hypothetical protein